MNKPIVFIFKCSIYIRERIGQRCLTCLAARFARWPSDGPRPRNGFFAMGRPGLFAMSPISAIEFRSFFGWRCVAEIQHRAYSIVRRVHTNARGFLPGFLMSSPQFEFANQVDHGQRVLHVVLENVPNSWRRRWRFSSVETMTLISSLKTVVFSHSE